MKKELFDRKTGLQRQSVRRPKVSIVRFAGAVIFIMALISVVFTTGCPQSSPKKEDTGEEKIAVSTIDLWNTYQENEVNADSLYKDKTIFVTGEISEIGTTGLFDKPYVFFSSGDTFDLYGVRCIFKKNEDSTEALSPLREGQIVTISGTCDGLSTFYVDISDCVVEISASKTQSQTIFNGSQSADEDKNIKESVSEILNEVFTEEEISKIKVNNKKIEVTILYQDTASEEQPDGWEDIYETIFYSGATLRELFSEEDISHVTVYLKDQDGVIMLTYSNTKISYSKYESNDYVTNNPSTITLAEFNKIQTGMDYQEVFDIIGGRGELIYESDYGLGSEHRSATYEWEGEGSLFSSATVTFRGGAVSSKHQYGLE